MKTKTSPKKKKWVQPTLRVIQLRVRHTIASSQFPEDGNVESLYDDGNL